jgi:hypothetical protein
MAFLVVMLGFFGFLGGIGLYAYGSSQHNGALMVFGGILGVLGFVLMAFGGYLNQNRAIDRLRGGR